MDILGNESVWRDDSMIVEASAAAAAATAAAAAAAAGTGTARAEDSETVGDCLGE